MDESLPELLETGGALNIRYKGRLLYPERGPRRFAERLSAMAETGPARLHLAFSPGLWYGASVLIERLLPGSAVLFIEADPNLAALAAERAPRAILENPKVRFLSNSDPRGIIEAAQALGTFRTALAMDLSGGAAFRSDAYRAAFRTVRDELEASWKNRSTLLVLGRRWAANIFANLAAMAEISPKALPRPTGAFVVAGAGPSLEAALPYLRRNRDSFHLLACDTALGTLVGKGLIPDIVVCLEGQAHNLADFTVLGDRETILIADLSSHPATFRAVKGAKCLTLVGIAPGRFGLRLREIGLPALCMPPLGSVGVHAIHIARRLASGPVFCTGLDFSFESGKTHARGSPAIQADEFSQTRLSKWPRQAGAAFRRGTRKAPEAGLGRYTDPVLSSYAELLASELTSPGPVVYDIREGGMPIGASASTLVEFEASLHGVAESLVAPASSKLKHPKSATSSERFLEEESSFVNDRSRPKAVERASQPYIDKATAFIDAEALRLRALRDSLRGITAFESHAFISGILESDYLLWPFPDPERLVDLPQDFLNRLALELDYWILRFSR